MVVTVVMRVVVVVVRVVWVLVLMVGLHVRHMIGQSCLTVLATSNDSAVSSRQFLGDATKHSRGSRRPLQYRVVEEEVVPDVEEEIRVTVVVVVVVVVDVVAVVVVTTVTVVRVDVAVVEVTVTDVVDVDVVELVVQWQVLHMTGHSVTNWDATAASMKHIGWYMARQEGGSGLPQHVPTVVVVVAVVVVTVVYVVVVVVVVGHTSSFCTAFANKNGPSAPATSPRLFRSGATIDLT